MDRSRQSAPRCSNCGVEIPWKPVTHQGRFYCCGGCAQGGPCYCSYDLTALDTPPGWERTGNKRTGAARADRQPAMQRRSR